VPTSTRSVSSHRSTGILGFRCGALYFRRPAAPRTLPTVASVRQVELELPDAGVAETATGRDTLGPDLGNAIPHETISSEPISTGLSFASSDASVRGTGVVVVVTFFMISTPRAGESPQTAGLPGGEVGVFTP
jgi:hypothetical protein